MCVDLSADIVLVVDILSHSVRHLESYRENGLAHILLDGFIAVASKSIYRPLHTAGKNDVLLIH
jgi:hypothetical protein